MTPPDGVAMKIKAATDPMPACRAGYRRHVVYRRCTGLQEALLARGLPAVGDADGQQNLEQRLGLCGVTYGTSYAFRRAEPGGESERSTAMTAHSRNVSRVRARMAYTGESLQQAALQLLGQAPGTPLVPDAALPEQALLEYRVLSALAARVGRHEPSRFGRAPYGIRSSSPSPDGIGLYLADEAMTALVGAVLPRRSSAGAVLGIEGLRYRPLSRHRVLLYLPESDAAIVLHKASASWRRAVAELGTTEPDSTALAWSDDPWTPIERAAADRRANLVDEAMALRWSTAVRRIGLARDAATVDFTNALPTMADLAGPYPDLLRSARAPRPVGVTVACVAHRGGTGRTTTVVNVGASLAEAGKRVLIIDLDAVNGPLNWYARDRVAQTRSAEARTATARLIATGDWSSVADQLITLHASAAGGHLAVLPGPVNCTQAQLQAVLEAAAGAADLVLLDAPPLGAGPAAMYAAQLADSVFTCVPVDEDVFGTTEASYSDEPQVVLDQDTVWSWLDDAYDCYVDLAEVLRIQKQEDELVAPTEMLDNALTRIGYTGEALGDCLVALSGLDTVYEMLDEDGPADELTEEDWVREAAAEARIEAWRKANRRPFLAQVAEAGRHKFGSTWDRESPGWVGHNAELPDVSADAVVLDHPDELEDDGGLAAEDSSSGSVEQHMATAAFVPHTAEEVAAELEKVLHRWGCRAGGRGRPPPRPGPDSAGAALDRRCARLAGAGHRAPVVPRDPARPGCPAVGVLRPAVRDHRTRQPGWRRDRAAGQRPLPARSRRRRCTEVITGLAGPPARPDRYTRPAATARSIGHRRQGHGRSRAVLLDKGRPFQAVVDGGRGLLVRAHGDEAEHCTPRVAGRAPGRGPSTGRFFSDPDGGA